MKKRKVLAVLLCAAMTAALAVGCGGSKGSDSSDKSSDSSSSSDDVITVGFSQVGAESDWRTANSQSMKDTFSKENGYDLIFDDAQQKQENQITAIRNFIQQEVDYILLAPVTETGWDTVLQEAKDADIPVIIVDRMVDVSDDSLYTTWIGTDALCEGRKAAEWLNGFAEAKGIAASDIHIADIQGTIGSTAQIGRTKGLEEGVDKYGWDLVAQQTGEFTQAKGQEVMEGNVVLTMRDISKTFPGVKALQHVDFTLRKGEIHALMGENGAGKSTLIKVLTGVHEFENGEIRLDGKDGPIINKSPQDAQNNGISTVYQEVNLCPNLTVAENLFIGREPRKAGFIDWRTMNKRATELLKSLEIDASATQKLEEVSLARQQMIAIARAVDMKCKVLILDEPTSSLDDDEVAKLFKLMNRLKNEGVGIIFVTHFLEQVYEVCDRITVLRNGELVGEYEVKDLPRVMLVAKMMGKDFDDLADIKGDHAELKEFIPVIEAEGLSHKGTIKPFDMTINKGEVVGFTGLLGSGRSELVRAIYGADKADSGKLKVNGKEVKIHAPIDAMKLGMAYLPEDRKKDGIIADLSVRENIIIALQAKKGMFHPMSRKEMDEAADKYIKMLQIKTASRETPIKSLSGGNQQKVIIGRWLLTNPDFLILDEPTRGIDIGTKTEIQKLVLDLADQGMAVAFISSEVEEMLRTCSRMAVMRDGKKVGEISGDELSQEGIMKAIAGGEE